MTNNLIMKQTVSKARENYLLEISEPIKEESVKLENTLNRILSKDILTKTDLPTSNRALIDGYAVNASDITNAEEKTPVTLKIIGEINVGDNNKIKLSANETVKIAKGAILPENTNAVVMPEDSFSENSEAKILKSVISGSQVVQKGADLQAGEIFLKKHKKIRPQDIGGLIGLGYKEIYVFKKPVVSIIPTGNELVSIDETPNENQIIASNGYVLKGFIEQMGGIAIIAPIVKDDLNLLKEAISKALEVSDIVLISGGSSNGAQDYTLEALNNIKNSKIMTHSLSMRPGNHTLLAFADNKPVIGLPGHPVSSLTSFHVFVAPVLKKTAGSPESFWKKRKDAIKLNATLSKNIQSPEGKEDYVRVELKETESKKLIANPYTGKSSFLSTLVKSHGLIKLAADCTGLYEGDNVEVILF